MRYTLLILVLIALLISSCDRFEHNFAPQGTVNFDVAFFEPMDTALNAATASDMTVVSAMYAEDYMHFGVNKANRIAWLQSFLQSDPAVTFQISDTASEQQGDTNATINWRLKIVSSTKAILADSLFVGEKLEKISGTWVLKGNNQCAPQANKQLVIAEYFTFRTCPNCPESEAKLNELHNQYPQNFMYLEHHLSGELAFAGDTTYGYYQAYSAPTAVFQGEAKIQQSTASALAQYQAAVDNLVTIDKPIHYSIDAVNVVGNEVMGYVTLNPLSTITATNLVLNVVIYADESEYTNVNGDPLHNVVRGKTSIPITAADFGNPIAFSVTTPLALPPLSNIAVFAQSKPTPFANNATIYGGATMALPIEVGVKK